MATQIRPRLVDEPGVRFGIATGVLVLTFLLAGAAGLDPATTAAGAVLAGGLAVRRLGPGAAAAIGVIAWSFFTGFVENTFGELTLGAGDLVRLAGFALATVAVAAFLHSGHVSLRHPVGARRG